MKKALLFLAITLTSSAAFADKITEHLKLTQPTIGTAGWGDKLNNDLLTIDSATVYNVKGYGAKGDGSTDDTSAIQSALNAAHVSSGTVFFPAGHYMVSATLNVRRSTNLIGAGPLSTRRCPPLRC